MQDQKKEILKSLAKIAWADGEVTQEERALLFTVCLQLGATEEEVAELDDVFGQSEASTANATDLKAVLPEKSARLNVIRMLLTMSMVDGAMAFSEFDLIEKTCQDLDISAEELESLRVEADSAAKAFQQA